MNTIIVWFRQDLRLSDHPALQAAARDGERCIPVYIHDDGAAGTWAPGGASRWWLHHSLEKLDQQLRELGGHMVFRNGATADLLRELCEETGATAIYCSRRYEPWAAQQEQDLHALLADHDLTLRRYPGSLLHEPGSVLTQGGDPFKVFTPFWRACQRNTVAKPLPVPELSLTTDIQSDSLESWGLLPQKPNWAQHWPEYWSPGEEGGRARLEEFLDESVGQYAAERDLPAVKGTSRLSPHIHFGELSPRMIWDRCEQYTAGAISDSESISKFQAELGWREFSYHLLHFFPTIPEASFKDNFEEFPWIHDEGRIHAWQRGQTGYPIVDAGMRELWSTGHMHNRVRMVVASFLCKHLLTHWRVGEDWFWDTLVDADLASNGCSWQWVAGSGADAAPYFRIFNPVTQGEKFDKQGEYVRHWVPEIAGLPDKFLHKPWETPPMILEEAGISLGDDYPHPLVDHKQARQSALDAYETIKLSKP
ncbi:MAG: deoxyribodipyrimidine photo-lyase [Pseudomonadota bacterium]